VGVKFGREYEIIIEDLVQAIHNMEGCAELLEIGAEQWEELDEADRAECLRTLSDDIFYGLGSDPVLPIGDGVITYDADKHTIQVKYSGDKVIRIIHLI
jgi:hypothetical protein